MRPDQGLRELMLARIAQALPPLSPIVELAYPGLTRQIIDWETQRARYFGTAAAIGISEDTAGTVLEAVLQEQPQRGFILSARELFGAARQRLYDLPPEPATPQDRSMSTAYARFIARRRNP
ncbi:hypothetical protein [Streptomyces sp. NPDC087437]|uniref:hypothetical protein n=1 Tax=Streptomyces sp. NPDC087437 TaxID=3365789 RepID=UPI0037F9B066